MILEMKNFRAIQEDRVELAPITVVYGPNGAGKSSLLYTLLTLKNVVLSSMTGPAGFFNFAFASLGGFESVVFNHQINNKIELALTLEKGGFVVRHGIS